MDIYRISKLKIVKKKQGQDLRSQSVFDLQRFRALYLGACQSRGIAPPEGFDKLVYKAISMQTNLTHLDFRLQDVGDNQLLALVETLLEIPIISSLDLRDNAITEEGGKALLELLRHQLILTKATPNATISEYFRLLTKVELKNNAVSEATLTTIRQYTAMLAREDKRLEIKAILNQLDFNASGGLDENEIRVALKLCSGAEPNKKDVAAISEQLGLLSWQMSTGVQSPSQKQTSELSIRSCLENLLLARYAKSPAKKDMDGLPPMEALAQIRHAELVMPSRYNEEQNDKQVADEHRDSSIRFSSSLSSNFTISHSIDGGSRRHSMESAPASPPISPRAMGREPLVASSTFSSPATTPRGSLQNIPGSPRSYPPVSTLQQNYQVEQTLPSPQLQNELLNQPAPPPPPSQLQDEEPAPQSPPQQHLSNPTPPSSPLSFSRPPSIVIPDAPQQNKNANHDENSSTLPHLVTPSAIERDYKLNVLETLVEVNEATEAADAIEIPPEVPTLESLVHQTLYEKSEPSSPAKAATMDNKTIVIESQTPDNVADADEEWNTTQSLTIDTTPIEDEMDATALSSPDIDQNAESVNEEDDSKESEIREEKKDVVPWTCEEQHVMFQSSERVVAKLQSPDMNTTPTWSSLFPDICFSNIVALILSNSALETISFQDMQLRHLRVLDLSFNCLCKIAPTDVLDLSHNAFRSIHGIEHLSHLRAVSFAANRIKSVKNLEFLGRLEILNLAQNEILTPQALRLLSLNKSLTHLNIDDNPVVSEGNHRHHSAHILNIIPTLRSLGCIHLAAFMLREKKIKTTKPEAPSMFEDISTGPYWIAQVCENLGLVCDVEEEPSDTPTPPKLSRHEQRMRDELRAKCFPHQLKKEPEVIEPPPVKKSKAKQSFSEQQKKAILLSTPRESAKKPPPQPKSAPAPPAAKTIPIVSTLKGFLQPTQASINSTLAAEQQKKTKVKKPKSAYHKRLLRREEKIRRYLTAASPTKLATVSTAQPVPTPVNAPTSQPSPKARSQTSAAKPASPTAADAFLNKIRYQDFVTHVEEDHATALTALDILVSMCERKVTDMSKFIEYKTNLESIEILSEHTIDPSVERMLATNADDDVRTQVNQLKMLKDGVKALLSLINWSLKSIPSETTNELLSECKSLRASSIGILLSASTTQVNTSAPAISLEKTSLDFLSPVNKQPKEVEFDETTAQVPATTSEQTIDNIFDCESELTLDEPSLAISLKEDDTTSLSPGAEEAKSAESAELKGDESFELASDDDVESEQAENSPEKPAQEMINQAQASAANEEESEDEEADNDGIEHGEEDADENEEVADENDEVDSGEEEAGEEEASEEEAGEEEEEEEEDDDALTYGDWEQGFDDSSQHHYWFNTATEESSWTPPPGWPYDLQGNLLATTAHTPNADAESQEEDEESQEEDEEMSLEERIALALQGGNKDQDEEVDFDDNDSLPDL